MFLSKAKNRIAERSFHAAPHVTTASCTYLSSLSKSHYFWPASHANRVDGDFNSDSPRS
jgi:hypothetical protein